MFTPEKWAESIGARSQHKVDDEKRRQEEFVLRRKMLDDEAPRLWRQLRESFKQFSEAYNKQKNDDLLFFANTGDDVFHVRHKHTTGKWLVVERIRANTVSVLIDSREIERYQVSVFAVGDGTVALVSSSDRVARSPEEIAAASLEKFLGI